MLLPGDSDQGSRGWSGVEGHGLECGVLGLRALGFGVLGFRALGCGVLGLRALGFGVLGFRALGVWGFGV